MSGFSLPGIGAVTSLTAKAEIADDLLKKFQIRRNLVHWADSVGPKFREVLKAEAPIGDPTNDDHSGQLRNTIRYRREQTPEGVKAIWSAYTPYATFVVRGTGEHEIHATAAQRLHFIGASGDEVFADSVEHPGAKPNDFVSRAWDREGAGIKAAIDVAIMQGVAKP